LPRGLTFSETELTLGTKVGEQLPKPVGGQTHYHNYDEDARSYRDFRLSSIMLSLEVEEEHACVGRGAAGQLATLVLLARIRPDVYKKKDAPRVAVPVGRGLVVEKSLWRCSSRGSLWWGTRLLALRC
jgi:hypothetical protein